ncbi:MAG: hypothetical protein Fues2KO_12100 [Fuerstiella sp.]
MEAVQQIWEAVDDAVLLADVDRRTAVLTEQMQQVRRLLRQSSDDSSLWYLYGYISYMLPDRRKSSDLIEQTEAAFARAIALCPEFSLPRLYLGFHHYDLEQFEAARAAVEEHESADLPPDLSLKWSELKLCIDIRLHGIHHCADELSQFAAECCVHPLEEVVPFLLADIAPDQLAGCKTDQTDGIRKSLQRIEEASGFPGWLTEPR